ncbi:MAG: hypothetical protein Q9170_003573 [Blastenia crenularia]
MARVCLNSAVVTILLKHLKYYQNSCPLQNRQPYVSCDSGQHVPLETYKDNLRKIIQHPTVTAQRPRLILVTPPPINEYALEESDTAKGIPGRRRTAENTKLYADACREVGWELNLLVLDLWTWFAEEAGYRPYKSHTRPGSKSGAGHPFFDKVLSDAVMINIKRQWPEQLPESLVFELPPWSIAPPYQPLTQEEEEERKARSKGLPREF